MSIRIIRFTAIAILMFVSQAFAFTYTVGHGSGYNFDSITAAMQSVSVDDILLVADGSYSSATGEVFPITMKRGVTLKRQDPSTRPHIIGDINASIFYAHDYYDFGTVIDGFEISGGEGELVETYRIGGAFVGNNVNLTIMNCHIHSNTADFGGAFYLYESNPKIVNCTIHNNMAQQGGGGIACFEGNPEITNSILYSNEAGGEGGAIFGDDAYIKLTNTTITQNIASVNGGAVYLDNSSTQIKNCILWNDSPDEYQADLNSTVNISYSDVQGGVTGTGNLNSDPAFVDTLNGNFHLSSSSPCIDAGTSVLSLINDIDNEPRPNPNTNLFDIGADEYYSTPASTITPTPTSTPTFTPTPRPTSDYDARMYISPVSATYQQGDRFVVSVVLDAFYSTEIQFLDAAILYDPTVFNEPTLLNDYVLNLSDGSLGNSRPGRYHFSKYTFTGASWSVTIGDNVIYDLQFTVKDTAATGQTTIRFEDGFANLSDTTTGILEVLIDTANYDISGTVSTPTPTPTQEPTSYPVDLSIGWNSFTLPVDPQSNFTASTLATAINNSSADCTHIARWFAGSWQIHQVGLPFNNFNIEVTQGYFIRCSSGGTWMLDGFSITNALSVDLSVGWSFVGIPYSSTSYTAATLATAINNAGGQVEHLAQWDAGGWKIHQVGLPFNLFNVENDQAYFLRSLASISWTP